MKRKVLFISSPQIEYNGGSVCSNRNKMALSRIFGTANIVAYEIKFPSKIRGFLSKIWRIMNGYFMGGDNDVRKIRHIIETQNITDLFFDSSLMGELIYLLKKNNPKIRMVSFFHNYEPKRMQDNYRGLKSRVLTYLALKNEKKTCLYSDKIIALSHRDSTLIQQSYNRSADEIIPITIDDRYDDMTSKEINPTIDMLFIGSYYLPNVEGIMWFINNVLNYVNGNLVIIGSGMEKLQIPASYSTRVKVYSFVENLDTFYYAAKMVVLPIFKGAGMKVKTAEAMMYGKYIIGTPEAFSGYSTNSDNCYICNTANDFISAINSFNLSIYRNAISVSRALFNTHYTNAVAIARLKNLME